MNQCHLSFLLVILCLYAILEQNPHQPSLPFSFELPSRSLKMCASFGLPAKGRDECHFPNLGFTKLLFIQCRIFGTPFDILHNLIQAHLLQQPSRIVDATGLPHRISCKIISINSPSTEPLYTACLICWNVLRHLVQIAPVV